MKRILLFLLPFGALAGVILFIANAADQMRTNESLVYSSDVAVSGTQNANFTVYIGDNLSGVPGPVKSVYFVASGVYTGGGTVSFTLDGDNATTQTFTLPTVGSTPTSFELIYKDPTDSISPTSAGSYDHTLSFTPSGVTLYGVAVKMTETHEYVPASCPDGSTEKVKTNESLVFSSNTSVASSQNIPVTLYIGDNLSGISNPLKSLYFVVTGVYTGNGTLAFSIDADGGTTQTFTLPNVGSTPTPFELVYKDPSNKINPTSAGEYSYTLGATPSGVTLYGLGIKLIETHQYVPGSCGGLPPFGDLISSTYDTGVTDGVAYNSVLWKGSEGTGLVKFQLATSNCSNGTTNYPTCSTGSWNYIGGDTCQNSDWYSATSSDNPVEITCAPSNHNNHRYYRYKIRICSSTDCTSSGITSPVVDDVVVNWSP